jgi:RNA polymerase sigma factor (sigma-70 family)
MVQTGDRITDTSAYLSTAAFNEALHLRRDRAGDDTLSLDDLTNAEQSETPQDEPTIPAGLKAALRTAVDQLPAKVSEVMTRFYFGNQPVEQIAYDLGISKSTVTSHLVHGRNTLRSLFVRQERKIA